MVPLAVGDDADSGEVGISDVVAAGGFVVVESFCVVDVLVISGAVEAVGFLVVGDIVVGSRVVVGFSVEVG